MSEMSKIGGRSRPRYLLLNTNTLSGSLTTNTYKDINTNICNSYIAYSCRKLFGISSDDMYGIPDLASNAVDKAALRSAAEAVDITLLFLQDQLRTSFPDKWYETALINLREATAGRGRLVCLSLAANSLDGYDDKLHLKLSPKRRAFFDYLAEAAMSIGIRGHYTDYILDRLGIVNRSVVGCPSFFECGAARVLPLVTKSRVKQLDVAITGQSQLGSPVRTRFYLQGDVEWPVIELIKRKTLPSRCIPEIAKGLSNPGLAAVVKAAGSGRCHFMPDFDSWKAHIYKHCSIAVGSRLHGAILATNAGLPAIVTNTDARAQESCSYLGIPWRPESFRRRVSPETLHEQVDIEGLNRRYLEIFGTFSDWAKRQGLAIEAHSSGPAVNSNLDDIPREHILERIETLRKLA